MRYGLRLWLLCLVTTGFLAGCGESSAPTSSRPESSPPESAVAASASPDGELLTNSIGMKLKLIPMGEFMMGSPADEAERDDDEGPVHKVGIAKGDIESQKGTLCFNG